MSRPTYDVRCLFEFFYPKMPIILQAKLTELPKLDSLSEEDKQNIVLLVSLLNSTDIQIFAHFFIVNTVGLTLKIHSFGCMSIVSQQRTSRQSHSMPKICSRKFFTKSQRPNLPLLLQASQGMRDAALGLYDEHLSNYKISPIQVYSASQNSWNMVITQRVM